MSSLKAEVVRSGHNNFVVVVHGTLGEQALSETIIQVATLGARVRVDGIAFAVEPGGVLRLGWAAGDDVIPITSIFGGPGKLAESWLEWQCPSKELTGDVVLWSEGKTGDPVAFMIALDCTKQGL